MKHEQGYIKLWRKFTDTEFFSNSHCVHVAIYLLINACREPQTVTYNETPIKLRRGQCVVGIRTLSKKLKITERAIRTSLSNLEKLEFLSIKTTHRFSVISIGNYNHYQEKPTQMRPTERHTERHTEPEKTTHHFPSENHKNRPTEPEKTTHRATHQTTQEQEVKKDRIYYPPTPLKGEAAAGASGQQGGNGEGEPQRLDPAVDYIVKRYKETIGIPGPDPVWDNANRGKSIAHAIKIIEAFSGYRKSACDWFDVEIDAVKAWADKNNRTFTLGLLVHKAVANRGKFLEELARRERQGIKGGA